MYVKLMLVKFMLEDKVMEVMNTIEYGVANDNNENLLKIMDEDEVFNNFYYLQTPDELMESKIGTCP